MPVLFYATKLVVIGLETNSVPAKTRREKDAQSCILIPHKNVHAQASGRR